MIWAPPGDARLERDPTGIAAHHFARHDARMRFGSGMYFVDGVGCRVQRGIEAKCDFGGGKVFVNSFGDANDFHYFAMKIVGNFRRTVAVDGDDDVHPEFRGIGDDFVGDIADCFLAVLDRLVAEGTAAIGDSEEGAAVQQNAADAFQGKFARALGPDDAIEKVGDADHLPLILEDGGFYGGANDGVETRCATAPGADSYAMHVGRINPRWLERGLEDGCIFNYWLRAKFSFACRGRLFPAHRITPGRKRLFAFAGLGRIRMA
jgi:hypothetical protein